MAKRRKKLSKKQLAVLDKFVAAGHTPKAREKARLSMLGHKVSVETRELIRQRLKAKPTKRPQKETDLRTCFRCKETKPQKEFSTRGSDHRGILYYAYCKPCHAEYQTSIHPNRQTIDAKNLDRQSLASQELKRCAKCNNIWPLKEFYGDPRHEDGKQSRCKSCFSYDQHEPYLKRRYGISSKEYSDLLEVSDGRCMICRRPEPRKRRLSIEHSHSTGILRGICCNFCNTNIIPLVERKPNWVLAAFEYLRDCPASKVLGVRVVPEKTTARTKKYSSGSIARDPFLGRSPDESTFNARTL